MQHIHVRKMLLLAIFSIFFKKKKTTKKPYLEDDGIGFVGNFFLNNFGF